MRVSSAVLGVIRGERQKSLKFLLVNPRKANIARTLRNLNMENISTITIQKYNSLGTHSCTVPFSRLLAVLFATTAIGIAERKLLLSVGIAQPRCNFEIRLNETKIVGAVGALFLAERHNTCMNKIDDSQRPSSDPFSRPIPGRSTGQLRIWQGRARRERRSCRDPHGRAQGRLLLPLLRGAAKRSQDSRLWRNPSHAAK
jgi:hypothetical protein